MDESVKLFGFMDATARAGLTGPQRLVAWWMAAHGGLGREISPTWAEIGRGASLSRRAVARTVAELQSMGWLVRRGTEGQVVRYTLAVGSACVDSTKLNQIKAAEAEHLMED